MISLKKLPLILLSFLLFTACKKTKFDSTGTLVLNFKNGIPSFYSVYTEEAYGTTHLSILSSGLANAGGVKITKNGNTMTIEGLNYGTYIISTNTAGIIVVQVAAGKSKTYDFY